MSAKSRESVLINTASAAALERLTDAEYGALFRAVIGCATGKPAPDFENALVGFAFDSIIAGVRAVWDKADKTAARIERARLRDVASVTETTSPITKKN